MPNSLIAQLADGAAGYVTKAPAHQRNVPDENLGAGQRLVGGLPYRQADRVPAGALAQLAPLPELREAAVRSFLHEGVPGVAISDAERGQLRHRP